MILKANYKAWGKKSKFKMMLYSKHNKLSPAYNRDLTINKLISSEFTS